RRWPTGVIAPVAAVLLIASSVQLVFTVRRSAAGVPKAAIRLVEWLSPLRSVNQYGLFEVMTTRRPEIVVEGSDDGRTWRPYEFRWKPGAVGGRPRFVAPHQPRLDWQMWFAALESCEENPWLVSFLGRLLQGEPAVLRLLAPLRAAEETGEMFQISRNGRPAAVLVSAQEWYGLVETLEILSDPTAMKKLARARRETSAGRFHTHQEVWGSDVLQPRLSSRGGERPAQAPGRRGRTRPARSRAPRKRSRTR